MATKFGSRRSDLDESPPSDKDSDVTLSMYSARLWGEGQLLEGTNLMKMTLTWLRGAYICACGAILSLNCVSRVDASQLPDRAQSCPGDNGGITLSPGFCATVFADNLGHPRHMVVSQGGVL